MISQFESFLCPDKEGIPDEGRKISPPNRCVSTNNKKKKNEDNSPKNHNQNNFNKPLQLLNNMKKFASIAQSSLYILVWFGFFKCHINHRKLFDTNAILVEEQ